MSRIAIGVDLGGTRIKTVAIDKNGDILEQLYLPTKDGDDAVWKIAVVNCIEIISNKLGPND